MNGKFSFNALSDFGIPTPTVRAVNYRFGFIGVGNMGGALARAASRSTTQIVEMTGNRKMVADTDKGQELRARIADLQALLSAYRKGTIKQHNT